MTAKEFRALERKLFPEYCTWNFRLRRWWDRLTTFCGYAFLAILAAGIIALLIQDATFLTVFLVLLALASGVIVFLPQDAIEAENVKIAIWGFLLFLLFLAWELAPLVDIMNLPRCSEVVKFNCRGR